MICAYRPERPSVWRDLLPFLRATWREGLPMLLPFVAVAVGMWL